MAKLIEACAGMTSARTKVDSIGGSLREGWGRLSQVENHTGANPRVKGRVFHSFSGHLLSTYCVLSPPSLSWALPHAAWEAFWVCFHKISPPLHRRPGPGHLLSSPVDKEVLAQVLHAIWYWAFGPLSWAVH